MCKNIKQALPLISYIFDLRCDNNIFSIHPFIFLLLFLCDKGVMKYTLKIIFQGRIPVRFLYKQERISTFFRYLYIFQWRSLLIYYNTNILYIKSNKFGVKFNGDNIWAPFKFFAPSLSFLRSVYCNLLYRFIETCCFKHFLYLVYS